MLMTVLDGNGNQQTIIVNGQGPAADFSGTITVAAISQVAAAANPNRSGILFQNTSEHTMTINDDGLATDANAFQVGPGESWPPAGYPPAVGAINVAGTTVGDPFVYREW